MEVKTVQHNILHTSEGHRLSNVIVENDYSEKKHLNDTNTKDIEKFEIDMSDYDNTSLENNQFEVPDMWSKEYIGLYSQYAAVGLLYGSSGTVIPFCVYTFDGETNVCSNSKNIVFFAWSFKLFFAILTDCYYPFGYRRKSWMLLGWLGVLLFLFILTIAADSMSISVWLGMLMIVQGFVMLSDVPADGYSVELGIIIKLIT